MNLKRVMTDIAGDTDGHYPPKQHLLAELPICAASRVLLQHTSTKHKLGDGWKSIGTIENIQNSIENHIDYDIEPAPQVDAAIDYVIQNTRFT